MHHTCVLFVDALEDKVGILGGISERKDVFINVFKSFLVNDAVGAFLFECSVQKLDLGPGELSLLRHKRLCNNLNFVLPKDLECCFKRFAQNGLYLEPILQWKIYNPKLKSEMIHLTSNQLPSKCIVLDYPPK